MDGDVRAAYVWPARGLAQEKATPWLCVSNITRGGCPSAATALHGVDHASHNKMLVKTGSSFNALVRALKHDLISSGALNRNRAGALEVDQVGAGGLACMLLLLHGAFDCVFADAHI